MNTKLGLVSRALIGCAVLIAVACGTSAEEIGDAGPDGAADVADVADASVVETGNVATYDGGPAPSCTGTFSITNQQPVTCIPYAANPDCLSCKELPGAGIGGPLAHLFSNSDATASALVKNAGTGLARFHGDGAGASAPLYYATASDPWYWIQPDTTDAGPTCYYGAKLDVRFHAPTGATYARSGGGDTNIAIWDQAQGLLVQMYVSIGTNEVRSFPMPNGCGQTASTACPLPRSFGGGCGIEQPFAGTSGTDKDWNNGNEPYAAQTIGRNSGAFAAFGGTVRLQELMLGQIKHALIAGYGCVDKSLGTGGRVFPADSVNYVPPNGQTCTPGAATGELLFTDYTDDQIAKMNVPPWQKSVLTALSHYGTYLFDTNGNTTNWVGPLSYNYGAEGLEAFRLAKPTCDSLCTTDTKQCDDCVDSPFFTWLGAQSNVLGVEDILPWSNVPVVANAGIEGHVHFADPCVAAGMGGATNGELGAPKPCVGSLWVNLAGPGGDGAGAGVVESTCSVGECAAISCVGGYCNLSGENGQSITLSAVPSAGHAFIQWSGACSGAGPCTVTLDGTTGVIKLKAQFD
ncbi:MAG TPA: hypothetical protein VGH28_17545 [Polyangiaceae bacterium]|jgi:hypothetical protein